MPANACLRPAREFHHGLRAQNLQYWAVPTEDFQYDSTSSAFRRVSGLSRFMRASSSRRQLLLEVGLGALWGAVLIVAAALVLFL